MRSDVAKVKLIAFNFRLTIKSKLHQSKLHRSPPSGQVSFNTCWKEKSHVQA